MLRNACLIWGTILSLLPAGIAHADSKRQEAFIIGSMPDAPPYVLEKPSRGIDLDIIKAAFEKMDVTVTFQHVPSLRLDRQFTSGRVDAISTNSTAIKGCIASKPFSHWQDAVMVRRGLLKPITSMVDLAGLNVATFPNAERVLGEALAPFTRYFRSYTYLINTDALGLLARGRLDAYIGDRRMVEYSMRKEDWQGETPYEIAFELPPFPRYLCFHDREMADRFDNAVTRLQAAGTDKAILSNYLPGQNETPVPLTETPAESHFIN